MHASASHSLELAPDRANIEFNLQQQARMVKALRGMLARRQRTTVLQIETHISFVLVDGEHAYKIKKALRTPFLDQSRLALRQQACAEELRLNRRLAPELYLAVVPITGTASAPVIGGQGAAIDCAVQMRAFAQDDLWERLAARHELQAPHIDELVRALVPFHSTAAVADPCGRWGSAAHVRAPLLGSLDELDALLDSREGTVVLSQLRRWESAAFERLQPVVAQRQAQGFVRECHGDLHMGNVTVVDGRTIVFDCIEFNDDFRWIDVLSDVAFMAMDLHAHDLPHLAHRFINGYLELSGDYGGVELLNYYLVHRALVRAKVGLLSVAQCAASNASAAAAKRAEADRYLELALRFSRDEGKRPTLMVTHGLSGSGKSTLTQGLLEAAGAIRIRADVERKRLAGLGPLDRSGTQACAARLYGDDMTAATYARLTHLAMPALKSGHHVILDATFLRRAQRDAARQLAAAQGVRCVILDFAADEGVLRERLRKRADLGVDPSDADEAVLSAQMRTAEPLQADETDCVFRCRPLAREASGDVQADWTPLLMQLAGDNTPDP